MSYDIKQHRFCGSCGAKMRIYDKVGFPAFDRYTGKDKTPHSLYWRCSKFKMGTEEGFCDVPLNCDDVYLREIPDGTTSDVIVK